MLDFFGKQEFKTRLEKTKRKMEERGIEVLLITDPANICYLSGYNAWSFYVHQMLVVLIDEEQPLWIGRGIDELGARKQTWMDPENIIHYGDDYVQNDVKHPMDFIAGVLIEKGREKATMAVEMDNYYFTAKAFLQLQKNLPQGKFVDAKELVNWVRIIKSPKEIQLMKRAARISEKGMTDAIEKAAPGVRQCDLAAEIYRSYLTGTDEYGGDYAAIVPLMPSGENTGACHMTWTDQPYKPEEAIILELSGCHQRYHSPMARTIFLGDKPPKELQRMSDIVAEGIDQTIDFIKPGVTCEEIESTWSSVLKKYGLEKESRIGYSTGLNYPPDWGEHTISLRPGDKTVVKENMTFHVIPGMWSDDFGFEISETIRVTEKGCEALADFPRKLFTK